MVSTMQTMTFLKALAVAIPLMLISIALMMPAGIAWSPFLF
jgi:hypothetical protein